MAIPSVVQGTVETEDGKVFELDSPKGTAWVESIGSFRFEPSGDSKPCTIRREPSGYWYGCRKVAGKVRKKYIGKSSGVNTTKLEEIAKALEAPPIPRVNKVAEVAQVAEVAEVAEVAQVAEVAEVAQDRLTALELEVASLRKALEALQEVLPGKLELGDSTELPKVADKVAEELQNELGNLKTENETLRRRLAETRDTIEALNWGTEGLNEQLATANQTIESLKQELAENTRYYTARLNEAGATLGTFKDKLEAAQAKNQRLQNDLGNSRAEVAELRSQLDTERASREEENETLRRSLENSDRLVSKKNQEISELNSRLAAAEQKISKLGDLGEDLESENQNLKSELARLVGENSEKSAAARELPEAADLYNQLKTKRKKSSASLADVELILGMIEES